jgi:hypothetical protein
MGPPRDPGVFGAGRVSRASLIGVYEGMRRRLETAGLRLDQFDTAFAELLILPHDDGGFCLPKGYDWSVEADRGYCGARDFIPPPSRPMAADAALAAAGWMGLQQLLSSNVLRCHTPTTAVYHRIFAVPKGSSDSARVIADLRAANFRGAPPPRFTLPSFLDITAAHNVRAGWAAKLDLKSAFYSIAVSPSTIPAFTTVLQDGRHAHWHGMPMGWSWAPIIFQLALEPLRCFIEAYTGSLVYKYLDDVMVLDSTSERVSSTMDLLWSSLVALGFAVAVGKSSAVPVQDLVFLGMGIDLLNERFYWPVDKAIRLAADATVLLRAHTVHVTSLQQLLGRLAFLCQVMPLASVWRRHLDGALALAGDCTYVPLSLAAREELHFWSTAHQSLGGLSFPWPDRGTGSRFVLRTDASDTGGGVSIRFPDGCWRRYAVLLPMDLRADTASAARELHVTMLGIRIIGQRAGAAALAGSLIDVYSDSTASVGAMRRGGRASLIEPSRELLTFIRRYKVQIDPHWLRRDMLEHEDWLSRVAAGSLVHCQFDPRLVSVLCNAAFGTVQPTLDVVATASNAQAKAYVAALPEVRACDVDGLKAPLVHGTWCFPPFPLAHRALLRCSRSPFASLCVVPNDVALTCPSGYRIQVEHQFPLRTPPSFVGTCSSPRPLVVVVFHGNINFDGVLGDDCVLRRAY